MDRWFEDWMSVLGFVGLMLLTTHAEAKKPLSALRAQIGRSCRVSPRQIKGARQYTVRRIHGVKGVLLGFVQLTTRRQKIVFVPLLPCAGQGTGLCPGSCLTLQSTVCEAGVTECRRSLRVLRGLDLMHKKTLVQPAAGSWWKTSVFPEPSNTSIWPVLLIQTRRTFKISKRAHTHTHVHILSLRTPSTPRKLLSVETFRLEPHPPGSLDRTPIGLFAPRLLFSNPTKTAPQLQIPQKLIPSPSDRCKCEEKDDLQFQYVRGRFVVIQRM